MRQVMLERIEQDIALAQAGTHPILQSQLAPIKERHKTQLGLAEYRRHCAFHNIHAVFDATRQQAWQDFETHKWDLRRTMIARMNRRRVQLAEEHIATDNLWSM
ncbi:hypothetical protein BDF19DRAFT_443196 [Syncephalis fuscata]|nr:hypothetical protein BDF19DRAFT_443196 [Syncephalis fuscata]